MKRFFALVLAGLLLLVCAACGGNDNPTIPPETTPTQTTTETGRFAARSPNLQNMPRASADDVGVRNFFIAAPGNVLLSLDFSQIELRVGAFYCRDEKMLDTYRAGGDIHDATATVIHTLSKAYPGYSRAETEGKIAHFLNSGTKPMTCAKIAEGGFKCPRMEDGSCGCKAPAALCYKALTVEELRAAMGECPVDGSAAIDAGTARQFVGEYLYNIEPAVAEAFINYEVKAHFRLKAADVKPLLTAHRELYKRYSESRETKRETGEDTLPDWYEITERGGIRFLPGILADHMAREVKAFYGAGSYYFYDHGVYEQQEDLVAQAAVRGYMIPRNATMTAITDAVGQWRICAAGVMYPSKPAALSAATFIAAG